MVKIVDIPEVLTLAPDEYADDVRAVDEAGKAGVLTFPTADLDAHVRRLHSSARSLGRSVKILSKDENGDDTDVTFIVRDPIKRPRKPVEDDSAE